MSGWKRDGEREERKWDAQKRTTGRERTSERTNRKEEKNQIGGRGEYGKRERSRDGSAKRSARMKVRRKEMKGIDGKKKLERKPGESVRAAGEKRVVETARYFIDGGGVMDRCDIIALRRSASNRIRVQGAAGYKVQRAHPSELRHALRGSHRDSICSHNTFLARMKKKEKREYRWAHTHPPLFYSSFDLSASVSLFPSFSVSSILFLLGLSLSLFRAFSIHCISHCNNAPSVTGTNLLHPWDRMRLDNFILPVGYPSFRCV